MPVFVVLELISSTLCTAYPDRRAPVDPSEPTTTAELPPIPEYTLRIIPRALARALAPRPQELKTPNRCRFLSTRFEGPNAGLPEPRHRGIIVAPAAMRLRVSSVTVTRALIPSR
jgi:hypothetical protein